jgi:hypothetical protein
MPASPSSRLHDSGRALRSSGVDDLIAPVAGAPGTAMFGPAGIGQGLGKGRTWRRAHT